MIKRFILKNTGIGIYNTQNPILENNLIEITPESVVVPTKTSDLINDGTGSSPFSTITPSGLELIDNSGWRLIGRDSNSYNPVAFNTVDFSYSDGFRYDATFGPNGPTAPYGVAFGFNNLVSGTHSVSFGEMNGVLSDYSLVHGKNSASYDNADYSLVIGDNARNADDAEHSLAFGRQVSASGRFSIAMGENSYVNRDYGISIGSGTSVSGYMAHGFGLGHNIVTLNEVVVGRFSENLSGVAGDSHSEFYTGDTMFRVGIGSTTNTRRDGLRVFKNGLVTAPYADNQTIDNNSGTALITKQYFASKSGATSINYQLDEVQTIDKWTDGGFIYRNIFTTENVSGDMTIPLTGFVNAFITIKGFVFLGSGKLVPFPNRYPGDILAPNSATDNLDFIVEATNDTGSVRVVFKKNGVLIPNLNFTLILEYSKF